MEHIFKRQDGTRVKVIPRFYGTNVRGNLYCFEVELCLKGKRKFNNVVDTDSFTYRSLSLEDREKFRWKESLKYITKTELLFVLDKLHASFKPTIRNTTV